MDVYQECPVLENSDFRLRLTEQKDCRDLLKVYSDLKAVPLFNSDNCNGDDFHYQTMARMAQAIDFWIFSYQERYFVRWSIVDRKTGEAVGTIEMFHRVAQDAFTDTVLLRLDLRSDYERADGIESVMSIVIRHAYEMFDCMTLTTKAAAQAAQRRAVLTRLGFTESSDALVGHDGTEYTGYFVRRLHT